MPEQEHGKLLKYKACENFNLKEYIEYFEDTISHNAVIRGSQRIAYLQLAVFVRLLTVMRPIWSHKFTCNKGEIYTLFSKGFGYIDNYKIYPCLLM